MLLEGLEWELGFSRSLFLVVLFSHLAALCILWSPWIATFNIWALLFRICVSVFLGLNVKRIAHMHLFRSMPRSVVKVWQDTKGRFGCQFKMGQSAYAEVKGDSYHTTIFIILRLSISHRVVNVIIPRDSMSPEAFKVLSSRLHQL